MPRSSKIVPVTFEALEKALKIDGEIEAIEVTHTRGIVEIIYFPNMGEAHEGAHLPRDDMITANSIGPNPEPGTLHWIGRGGE